MLTLLIVWAVGSVYSCAAFAANIMPAEHYSFNVTQKAVDSVAPVVQGCTPDSSAANIPLSTNIQLTISDALSGVDRDSIDIMVNGVAVVYSGVVQTYQNSSGITAAYSVEIIEKSMNEYVLMYDPAEYFHYEEQVTLSINAADLDGNALNDYRYSFTTQGFIVSAFSFFSSAGTTAIASGVQTTAVDFIQDHSRIASSSSGKNVFIAWEQRDTDGAWGIYCARSMDYGKTFAIPRSVNSAAAGIEQRYPSIAVDAFDNVYVSWQQKTAAGDWDIYIAKMGSGETVFGSSYRIYADAGFTDQVHPAITVGPALKSDNNALTQEPATVYAVWIETNGTTAALRYTRSTAAYNDAWYSFVVSTIRVDSDRWPQLPANPLIKIDASGRTFVSFRGANSNGTSSIYFDRANASLVDGTASFGTDMVVSNATAAAQGPELEVSSDGNKVYLLWKELASGQANLKFSYYRYSSSRYTLAAARQINADALTDSTLGGYALSVSRGGDVCAVWSALRDGNCVITIAGALCSTYQFSEYTSLTTEGEQKNPSLGMDAQGGHYYVGWTDKSSGYDVIYFCRNTAIVTDAVTSQKIENDSGGTVTVTEGVIAGTSIEVPPDAIEAPVTITVAEAVGAPAPADGIVKVGNVVDFGPGWTTFNTPVTIRLPYTDNDLRSAGISDESLLRIYYYNIGALDWELVPGSAVDAGNNRVSVGVSHFSMYMVAGSTIEEPPVPPTPPVNNSSGGGGSGGGGGCFIATAAFGTTMAKEVIILCEFRDRYLLTNAQGASFVKFYYRYSPPAADYIAQHNGLRMIIRACLKPLILFSRQICR